MSPRLCASEGCTSPHLAKGLCDKHYRLLPEVRAKRLARQKRYGSTSAARAGRTARDARRRADPNRGPARKEYEAAWRRRNRRKWDDYGFKQRFGIGLDLYDQMYARCGGLCAICGNPETAMDSRRQRVKRLAVDHCHSTGKIRGLLCQRCNQAIGLLRDDCQLLRSAITYLTSESAHGIVPTKLELPEVA